MSHVTMTTEPNSEDSVPEQSAEAAQPVDAGHSGDVSANHSASNDDAANDSTADDSTANDAENDDAAIADANTDDIDTDTDDTNTDDATSTGGGSDELASDAVTNDAVTSDAGDSDTGSDEVVGELSIRRPTEDDFFNWLPLYERYAAEHDVLLTDEKALRLWVWLNDSTHEENGFIAVANDALVGLVNFHEFSRPLASDRAIFIDDLYAVPGDRQHEIGSALIDAVREWGAASGAGAVQWATAADGAESWQKYDGAASDTSRVTYELPVENTGD